MRTVAKLSLRQEGFTDENGCANNLNLLLCGMKDSKLKKGGVFAMVDVEKAFDRVQARDGCVEIECNKRGIKQGDPISPLIFNCVEDLIVSEIENSDTGLEAEGKSYPYSPLRTILPC